MPDHDTLLDMLATRSAQRGQFTLASGRQSNLYIDARLTTMSADGLALIGPFGLEALQNADWNPDSIGGLTLGADPVTYAIAYASALAGRFIRAFTVRKAPKAHGTARLVEGPFHQGDRVVIIEDVITTGSSALQAADVIRSSGGIILGVLALVDREEGGREAISAAGLNVVALTRASEIMARIRD